MMLKSIILMLFCSVAIMAAPIGAMAQDDSTARTLSGPSDAEIRAREVGRSLRCVVCQNQSIEASNAPLAADMRTLVRSRIAKGDSNQQILDYMQNTYGDFVLLKPPFQANTLLLWGGPFLILLAGMVWFARSRRPGATPKDDGLTPQEQEKLAALLNHSSSEPIDVKRTL